MLKKAVDHVSIVIPVINEAGNVPALIEQIALLPKDEITSKIDEVLFVDDGSTDGTRELIRRYSVELNDFHIVLKERLVKHGTVNAQLYGIANCKNNIVIVMDGDLQHPVRFLSGLISEYQNGYDLVVASRYVKGGSADRTPFHGLVSRGATLVAKVMLPQARALRDPISGFFIVDRRLINRAVEPNGHNKLSLYILVGTQPLSVSEIPYRFMERQKGKSKVASNGVSYLKKYVDELIMYRLLHNERMKGKARSNRETDSTVLDEH